MKIAHEQETKEMEEHQKLQFIQFSTQWDEYMQDYEQTAITSMEKLRDKHQSDLADLGETIRTNIEVKQKPDRKVLELQKQIEVLVSVEKLE